MIEIRNLHKSFNQQKVLDGLNLVVEEGKITSIMGPSGVGKSVLLKLLIGILKPEQGEILVDGEEITQLKPKELDSIRRKFGMLFQDAALFDDMDVFDNVSFPLREHTSLTDPEVAQRVEEKLSEVGLEKVNEKYPNELSGGMRKRVGLARALVLDPKILLFDEPTTGLDPIITDQIVELILETHRRHRMTIVLISHDLALSYRVAHKVGMLYRGKIVEYSTPEQFRRSDQPFVREFLKAQASHESRS
jgi:phospholipid/cholesterol/gamma-HCH transport system ATP-binding protein